ncbi:MAG: acylphosphatase [Deltaproteobacteria bacterium]|nr:acylphosphatase [Deltaproteobacteria bacterium]
MAMKHVHLIISGKVQGVFFRAESKLMADRLGLGGWVKNVRSGDVEMYLCGSEIQVRKMVLWCQQGPARAKVEQVQEAWDCDLGFYASFEILE